MLTSSIVISGPQSVMEPTVPGTTINAHVSISLSMSTFGDSGTVQWATEAVAGGATPGDDFVASSGTVSLGYMNTQVYVDIPIKYDTVSESPKAFKVVLSNPTGNLAIMVGSATISITDNNPPPPPPPPNPPVPTVNFSGAASNFMLEGETRVIHVVRDMSMSSLTVYYVIAPDSVATSSDVTLSPAGSVTFVVGQTDATINLGAVDDSTIEVHELLKLSLVQYPAPNQGPGAYTVGSAGDWLTTIGDNNEDIFSDLTVAWKESDNNWVNSPDNEMLWQEDDLRWTVTVPSEEIPFAAELTSLKLLKRPHNNPATPWEEIPLQSAEQNPDNLSQFFIYANPRVGDWDITVHGVFGIAVNAWLAAPKHRAVDGFASTTWEKPAFDPDLRMGENAWMDPLYAGPRVYPEYTLPPDHVAGQQDHTFVDVRVTLAMAPPAGFPTTVFLKLFDPDHEFNPTDPADTGSSSVDPSVGNGYLDPNDFVQTPPISPLLPLYRHWPNDNRTGSSPTALGIGAGLVNTQLTFNATETVESTQMHIFAPQPGNNYIVGVSGHDIERNVMRFKDDGITLTDEVKTPAMQTDVLTVWRTLHIERDSMGPPPTNEVFDATQPNDDKPPTPWDVRDADTSMLAAWFLPADIDVVADLTAYDVKDGTDLNDPSKNFFMHNVELTDISLPPTAGTAYDKIAGMRDVANSNSFWSVQVIGAYEGPDDMDFDPNESTGIGGITWGGEETPFSLIFLETIRDRTAYVSATFPVTFGGQDPNVRATIFERRTVVHEVAHTFFGAHTYISGDPTETTIMGESLDYGTDIENRFSAKQLGLIEARIRPIATGQ